MVESGDIEQFAAKVLQFVFVTIRCSIVKLLVIAQYERISAAINLPEHATICRRQYSWNTVITETPSGDLNRTRDANLIRIELRHRETSTVASDHRVALVGAVRGARHLSQRRDHDQGTSTVLDQLRAVAMAAVYHPGNRLWIVIKRVMRSRRCAGDVVAVLRAGHHHLRMLLNHCTYHLDQIATDGLSTCAARQTQTKGSRRQS